MSQLAAWPVQVPAAAGERWKTTVATPEPASAESLASTTVPPTAAPFAGAMTEPVGGVASTSHVNVTSEASVFPAASVARALSVCEPSPRDGVVKGVVQGVQPPPSRSHSNVDGDSVEPRPNVGVALELGFAGRQGERRLRCGQVDRPGVRRRRRVDVAGGVLGPHLERVRGLGQPGVRLRARAVGERAAVEPALEARACVGRREREARARGVRVGGRGGGDRRVRGRRVDREREGRRASRRHCRRRRSRAPRACRCSPRAGRA